MTMLVFVLAALLPLVAQAKPSMLEQACLVVGIADGDTLTVRCGDLGNYQQVKVRLAEIDAPEKKQPYGQRSKESLSNLCFQTEALLKPQTIDRYGRTVARVECRGKDASLEQARTGMAWAYTKYLTDQAVFQAELTARRERVGLWRDAEPVAPWEWRKKDSYSNLTKGFGPNFACVSFVNWVTNTPQFAEKIMPKACLFPYHPHIS